MADIIDLSNIKEFKLRELEKILERNMTHNDADVLALWKKFAKESFRKYPGAPNPSKNQLSLEFPACVSEKQRDNIVISIKAFLGDYQDDVQNVMLKMLGDIILLQKNVAEDVVAKKRSNNSE